MSGPFCCCKETTDPGPWKAGVDDSADPYMVDRMHAVRNRLRGDMSNDDLIWICRTSAALDQRTRLGYHIQCCVLHNAAGRLELLAKGRDPYPYGLLSYRISQAWAVLTGRASAIKHIELTSSSEASPDR